MSDNYYGTAKINPSAVLAGKRGKWEIEYVIGKCGIKSGGGLRIIPPNAGTTTWELGKVIAFCDNPVVFLEVSTEKTSPSSYHHSNYPAVNIKCFGQDLKEGEKIKIIMGDLGGYVSGRFLQAKAQFHSDNTVFKVLVDPKGNANFSREKNMPDAYKEVKGELTVEVKPAEAAMIRISVRNCPSSKKNLIGNIAVEDEFENPIINECFEISLCVEKGEIKIPAKIIKPKGKAGIQFKIKNYIEKTSWISASSWKRKIYGVSNPINSNFVGNGNHIYFGDMHVMTGASCGHGNPEEAIKYARDVFGLDFTTITDVVNEVNLWWDHHNKLFKKYNKDHIFVTLPGYEKGFSSGHKNVYYLNDNQPAYKAKNPQGLWKFLENKKCMVISHHPNTHSETDPDECWSNLDISGINPKFEKLIEICQNRGSFEKDKIGDEIIFGGFGSSIRDILAKGFRLGFVGGTDTHRARPGSPLSNLSGVEAVSHITGGITGVICKELTREAVLEALIKRRCYATTSVRILIDLELNKHKMGEDVKLSKKNRCDFSVRKLSAKVAGTSEIKKIVIVRNGEEIYEKKICALEYLLNWQDKEKLSCIYDPKIRGVYYYMKVYQDDGNMAWSSPIWLTY